MARGRRSFFFVPLIITMCALMGGLFAPGPEEVNAATTEDDLRESQKLFTRVFALVEDNYADRVTPDKAIYKGAIPGMLRTLDPHSNFFDPKDYKQIREDQRGRYYGVGMSVGPKNNNTMVIAGSSCYSASLDACLNAVFQILGRGQSEAS